MIVGNRTLNLAVLCRFESCYFQRTRNTILQTLEDLLLTGCMEASVEDTKSGSEMFL